MPHIIIETNYSDKGRKLMHALHEEARTMEALPEGGLRTRMAVLANWRIADGDRANRFAYVTVRLGKGRSESLRREIGEQLFAVVQDWAAPMFEASKPISIGLEVEEIAGITFKQNSIHAILKERAGN